MEALLIIFAEILFACLAPLFSLIGAFFVLIVELIALALASLFGASNGTTRKRRQPSDVPTRRRKPLVSTKALHWTAGFFAGVAVLGVLASVLFFDPLLRTVLVKAGDRAGITVSYGKSSGSLLLGKVTLTDVALARESDDGLAFDLSVARVEADVALLSLLGDEPRIQYAAVDGVAGFVTPPLRKDEGGIVEPERLTKRRPFRADRAEVSNVDLEIRPREAPSYSLVIETGEVEPFRSKLALFDLLFRSNLVAELAGQPLRVATREISDQGRETIWAFEDVEAEALKRILPKAPLTWLNDGTLTARVEDRWDLTEDEIDMDWQIVLDGIDVETPEDAGRAERMLAGALAKVVDRQGGNADFRYRLELGPEEIAALRSGDLAAFWDTVLSGFIRPEIARAATTETGEDGETGRVRGAIESLRNRLRGTGDE